MSSPVRATPPVAVVDIGKTTAKLALVDAASGATLDARTRPNRVLAGPPYPHADVEGLWAFIVEGLSAVAPWVVTAMPARSRPRATAERPSTMKAQSPSTSACG